MLLPQFFWNVLFKKYMQISIVWNVEDIFWRKDGCTLNWNNFTVSQIFWVWKSMIQWSHWRVSVWSPSLQYKGDWLCIVLVWLHWISSKKTPCNRKWHWTGSSASFVHLIHQIKTNPAVPPSTHQRADWCSYCRGPASVVCSFWSGPFFSSRWVSPGTPGGWWCSALAPQCRSPSLPAPALASSAAPPAPSAPRLLEPTLLPKI